MICLSIIDLAETHGFSTLHRAAVAATRGDNGPLATFGLYGADPESAHHLCAAIERAWLGDSLTLAVAAIERAKGGAYVITR